MTKPYLEPEPEFFDRASVPKEIADLLAGILRMSDKIFSRV